MFLWTSLPFLDNTVTQGISLSSTSQPSAKVPVPESISKTIWNENMAYFRTSGYGFGKL